LSQLIYATSIDRGTDATANRFFVRAAFQQFPFQLAWWSGLSRATFMFNRSTGRGSDVLQNAVKTVIGLPYDELLSICIALYVAITMGQGQPFSLSSFAESSFPWMRQDILLRVLKVMSQTQDQFKHVYEAHRNRDPKLRVYDFNPLFRKPLIRINAEYYAPIPALVPAWVANSISYELSENIGDEFLRSFGYVFEEFVGQLLLKSKRCFIPESRIQGPRGKQHTADFVVIDGDKALIFDCKTRRFSLNGRYGVQEAIESSLEKTIVSGIKQAIRTERGIRDHQLDKVAPLLGSVSDFVYAVVTSDDYFLANAPFMRDAVAAKLQFDQKYHVISGNELELLLANLDGQVLVDFLKEKSSTDDSYSMPFGGYVAQWAHANRADGFIDPSFDIALSRMMDMQQYLSDRGLDH
jgi:hypothetical protein